MADLQVDIVTPERLVYSGTASEVRAPGWEGEFEVLPGHTLFLSLLHGGVLRLNTPEGEKRFVVGRGFAEAGPDRVTILTDRCVAPEDVDKDAARASLSELDGELAVANAFEEAATARMEEKIEIAQAMIEI
ncbi:MAG: ATP synthase F1 subunit epsilon [Myxococcota bacterium]